MSAGIFILQNDGQLVEMVEQPYESEDILQGRLADYPDLLSGDQIEPSTPRRWLLITREMGVPGEDDGPNRWSLDHLFLDQDGIPTLVEVKRASDTRIRREVVGQMLDYAANAVVHWPVERVRSTFETRCERKGKSPDTIVDEFIDSEQSPDQYWQVVDQNLKAGRVRLLFVADQIPPELRRVIEFLNKQMDPAQVLGVEIKQYVGNGMTTIVPSVVGNTTLKRPTVPQGRDWDEHSFFEELDRTSDPALSHVAKTLLDWGKKRMTEIWWGKGGKTGAFVPTLRYKGGSYWPLRVTTRPTVRLGFKWMAAAPFDTREKREEFRTRLNKLAAFDIPPEGIDGHPGVPMGNLADPATLEGFLEVMDWSVDEVVAANSITDCD